MIKNIVFDMGNVLVKYSPDMFLEGYTDFEKELYRSHIYESENWQRLDRGELSEDELIALAESQLPEKLRADAERLIKWYDLSHQIEGMEHLIVRLKAAGYNIYLLSNTSLAFHKFKENISALAYFDGLFISADCGLLKPDRRIFRLFCDKFSINPEECIFIDDTKANTDAAAKEGFTAILFGGDASLLERELTNCGIAIDA